MADGLSALDTTVLFTHSDHEDMGRINPGRTHPHQWRKKQHQHQPSSYGPSISPPHTEASFLSNGNVESCEYFLLEHAVLKHGSPQKLKMCVCQGRTGTKDKSFYFNFPCHISFDVKERFEQVSRGEYSLMISTKFGTGWHVKHASGPPVTFPG